jgi:single stranded DNA-binding protein
MGKTVNKVILLGNVGKDPEIKSTNGGTLVANLSLATAERFKDKEGEWQERAEWHNLVAYARGAEILRDYVKKGSKLYVEGRLTTRSWDDKDSGKKCIAPKSSSVKSVSCPEVRAQVLTAAEKENQTPKPVETVMLPEISTDLASRILTCHFRTWFGAHVQIPLVYPLYESMRTSNLLFAYGAQVA